MFAKLIFLKYRKKISNVHVMAEKLKDKSNWYDNDGLRNLPFRAQIFDQNGATCHTSVTVRQFLQENF